MMQDFVGFTYNGVHSIKDLHIYRTSNGNRYDNNLTATMTDKTADVPGGDGQYYFGTTFKNRTFTINYVFDHLCESDLQKIKSIFCGDSIHELVFDEEPYKAWSAKVTGTASMKYLCFDENPNNSSANKRIYKGEGSITFTCYYPFAKTPTKLWEAIDLPNGRSWLYEVKDGRNITNYSPEAYTNKNEWQLNSGLNGDVSTIKGDRPTTVVCTLSFENISDYNQDLSRVGSIDIADNKITFVNRVHITKQTKIVWDTKTGLCIAEEEGKKVIIPYSGNGIVAFPPGTKISVTPAGYAISGLTVTTDYQYIYN